MVEQSQLSGAEKKLNRLETFPWKDLNLNGRKADINIDKVDGMPEEYHYHCQVALQEALIQQKDELYEVADAVVKRLVSDTEEARWLCHIYPANVDIGLSYFRKGSICMSFGPAEIRYECRIACLY